jgi:hypothetical protein
MTNFLLSISENVLASYLIIILIKYIAFRQARRYSGRYNHDLTKENLSHIKFDISINAGLLYFLNPISSITLKLTRHGDAGDWKATLHSDILNIHHFKGNYFIDNPSGGHDGWLDAFLFQKEGTKIALHLHYLDPSQNKWVENEGYYIYK